MICIWCFFRSLVGGKVTVLLLVDVNVATFSVAVIKVATALEVVDVRVAVLEVVSVKVPFFLVGLERGRLHRHIRVLGQSVVECN